MLFQSILVAYDGSKASNKALEKAIALAKASPGAKLEVLHAFDFPRLYLADGFAQVPASFNQELYNLAEQTVNEARSIVAEAGVEGTVELVQGQAAEVILKHASTHDNDVIVLGSRGMGGIREFVLGSVSHNVAQHAKIPVLILK